MQLSWAVEGKRLHCEVQLRTQHRVASTHGLGGDKWCFLGVAILQRSIRLYAPFYSSDILIASPLGLRTIIGAEGEKKRDFDFLSSVELLIIDQADIYLMQNWEHVLVMLGFSFGGTTSVLSTLRKSEYQ